MGTVIRIDDKWDVLVWLRQDIDFHKKEGNKEKYKKYRRAYLDILNQLTERDT